MSTENGIMKMQKDNEIASLKKKYSNLDERYKMAVKDNNFKDEFIKKHLTGLSHEQDLKGKILEILGQYEGYFKNDLAAASIKEYK